MATRRKSSHADRVLVLAPRGLDGRLTCDFLMAAGISAEVCASLQRLLNDISDGEVGAVVVAEEAVPHPLLKSFSEILAAQPQWSDIPVLLFTGRAGTPAIDRLFGTLRGNVTILERPVRSSTVITAVRSALRVRARQYELRDLLKRMEESDRRKDEFLAMLGHELRNPLAAIHNALHVMQHSQSPELTKRQPVIIERQSRHLARLVDDLLDVSRVTMGKITLARQWVDLCDVANRCAQALESDAQAQRHTLEVDSPGCPIIVEGDLVRIEQILSNLVTNAIKYTGPGGHIVIRVRREGEEAVMTVKDDGIGLAPDMQVRVFELFTQVQQSLDRSRGGLGLGLSLVKSLVERHDGTISAFSEGEGKGSEFTVRLPMAAAYASVPVPPPDAVQTEREPLRILLIEDNPDARETMQAMLELWGHSVTAACDGFEGLEKALGDKPPVLLVDIGLPKIDGYEVARQVRAASDGYTPLLIAMTGYGQPEDKQRALDAGFDTHLVKPVQPADLSRLLSEKRERNADAGRKPADLSG
ncbi:MAG: histidine kinase [Myxococcales bacterium]|nr:histidine kinase [Myxococcales bacterium]